MESKHLSKKCKICTRTLAQPNKGIPCSTCNTLIHRRCSGISKLNQTLKTPHLLSTWQCRACNKENFPFAEIDDNDLYSLSFNSNFNCKCRLEETYLKNTSEHHFKYEIESLEERKCNSTRHPAFNNDLDNVIQLPLTFDYFQSHEFHKLTHDINGKNNFGLLHTNICSLQHNFDNLQHLINHLDYRFGVIALSETWNPLSKCHVFNAGNLDGYQKFTGTSGITIKSGCGFYIKNDIKFIPRKDLDLQVYDDKNEYQSKWIEIIDSKKVNTLVGVYYRHPKKTSDDTFNNDLKKTLKKISKENKNKIICGDFNYDLLKFQKREQINTFINTLMEECLQPTIMEPTRYVIHAKPSLIDNIFINSINKTTKSGNIVDKISDHMPNFVIIENFVSSRTRKKIKKRDMKHFDEVAYHLDLQGINFTEKIKEENDVDNAYAIFHKHFIEIIDKHAPLKSLSKKEIKQRQKPWITSGIQKSISKKNKFYGKFLKTKDYFWYRRYKTYRDSLNSLIRKGKNNYYLKYFTESAKNSKKLWTGINQALNKNSKNTSEEIFINADGKILDNQKNVANKFNNYFINVAQKLESELGECNSSYQDYLKNPNESSFFLGETEPGEILDFINELKIEKSPDIYGISPKLVKLASPFIAKPLVDIFNKSFRQGKFPNKLKLTVVFPIHKAESKMIVSNYRPISILPIISKLLEKIMHKRLMSFIKQFNLLDTQQFGFQKHCSTEHAIIDLYSKIVSSIDQREKSCCIFLDFAKAFDTVNHNILLQKLEYYGVRGVCLDWFKSYLENRKQCVEVGQEKSDYLKIKCGVPQGSVLGPLLFLLYINDISLSSKILQFHLFADDTSIFYSHKDIKILERNINIELKSVSNWLIANKLSLNVKKSNLLIFNQSTFKVTIKINNSILEEKESAKYLGIVFDAKLSWVPHINYVNKKLAKGMGLLAKLRHFVPKRIIPNLFNAFFQPHLDYGLIAWGSANKTQLTPIEKSLKKAVRICSFKNKYEPSAMLFKSLKVLTLQNNIDYQQGRFIWKCVNAEHPISIQNIFKDSQKNKLNRNGTKYDKLFRPFCKTSLKQNFALHSGIKLWNGIPKDISSKASIRLFSKYYKAYLIDN